MKKSDNLKPYVPPKITKVVLRKEQAVLSQCSTDATSNSSNDYDACHGAYGNCKKAYMSGMEDSLVTS